MTDVQSSFAQRLAGARALLADAGISDARVSAEGAQQEIAVVQLDAPAVDAVTPLVARMKQLGFRYVTIDLQSS